MWASKDYLDAGIHQANPPRQFKRLIRRTRDEGESQNIRSHKPLPIVYFQMPRHAVVLWDDTDNVLVTRAATDRFEQRHAPGRKPEQRVNVFRQMAVQPAVHGGGQLHESNAQTLHDNTKAVQENDGGLRVAWVSRSRTRSTRQPPLSVSHVQDMNSAQYCSLFRCGMGISSGGCCAELFAGGQ